MKKLIFAVIILFTVSFAVTAYSQNKVSQNLFTVIEPEALPNLNIVDNLVGHSLIFDVNKTELSSIYSEKPMKLDLFVPVSENEYVIASLEKFDILKPWTKIVEMTPEGEREVTLGDLVLSYKGNIAGSENSTVVFNITKDDVTAMMSNSSGNYVIGKLNTGLSSLDNKFILYRDSDLKIKNDFRCETSDVFSDELMQSFNEDKKYYHADNITDAPLLEADIALDVDYVTYLAYGSVTNTMNYIMKLMTAVSTLYLKEVNIKLVSSYIRIWTTPDPYTGTTSSIILNQFKDHWNSTQSGVSRTVAHLISIRSGGLGGIAWVNVLCDSPTMGNGYGFSNTDGNIYQLPTYSWDVMVVAHELGHNFGSAHTHSCTAWNGGPIDSCYQVEGNCYNGPVIPRTGTIMSYCHLTSGGISFVLGFGDQPGDRIRLRASNAPCVVNASEQLILAYPQGGETFRTDDEVPIYWGTSLTGTLNLEYSTNNGNEWHTISDNVNALAGTYNWTIPYIGYTDQALIRMYDSSNPSIGDTTTSTFRIILNFVSMHNISPPTMHSIQTSPGQSQTHDFVWSSAGTHPSISYKWSIRKGGTPMNSNLYFHSNSGGTDTSITITGGLLDSIASTLGANVGDSILTLWSGWAYNGYDSVSSNTFILIIKRTTIGIQTVPTEIPDKYALFNNYPNPFNPTTNIKFDLPENTIVSLKIFDISGREVASLLNSKLQAGTYTYLWNASTVSSGIYFYELSTPGFRQVKRMVLIK